MPRTKSTAAKPAKPSKARRKRDDDEDRDYVSAASDDEEVQADEEFDALDIDADVDPDEKADERADVDLDDEDAPRKRMLRRNILDIVGDDDDDAEPADDDDMAVEWDETVQVNDEPVEMIRTIRYVDPDERITSDMLNGKECGRLIGDRARMLDNGAKPLIANPMQYTNSLSIATAEFRERRIPFAVLRGVGNGLVERWPLDRLSFPANLLPDFERI